MTERRGQTAAHSSASVSAEKPTAPVAGAAVAEAVAWLKSGECNVGPRSEKAIAVVLEALAALHPQPAPAVAESQWRTMESAPTDSTHVLLSCDERDCHYVTQGWYDEDQGSWWMVNESHTDAHSSPIYPQFWQPLPLPAPPTVGSGSAQEGQANG